MSKTLSKSLSIDMAGLAQLLRKKGRGNDTVLAHITPKEAALLKRRGGSGTINPDTGLPEFDDSGYYFGEGGASASDWNVPAPSDAAPTPAAPTYNPEDYTPKQTPTTYDESQFAKAASGQLQPDTGTQKTAPEEKSWWDQTLSALGGAAGIAKAAGLLGVGAVGASQANKAAQQGQAAAGQIGAMAQPVQARSDAAQQQLSDIAAQTQAQGQASAQQVTDLGKLPLDVGTQMVQSAQAGALTPANTQALEALKAQTRQGITQRGGVGAMQAGVAEQTARATLGQQQLNQGLQAYQQGAAYGLTAEQIKTASNTLANNLRTAAINTGLTQAGIADQYTMQAIMTGLASDQQLAANMQKFYSTLASIGFGTAMKPTTTATE